MANLAYLQNFESIGSAVLYGICSTSMAFANKTIITSYSFDFPFFIMACQMMLCILFLETLRINSIVFIPKYSMKLDFGFILCFIIQVVTGVLLNYSLFLCTAKNSALTTSLVGVLKSILQTVIGFFTFGGVKFNSLNIFGISLNMFGGIMYSYAKYNERLKSNALNNVKPI
ncbi:hypothetical protein TNCV_4470451 [Trichonephila clavipes]|uniref:Sugar phosphate transporter domain-containing protein n=1 Tax=Trichonephila clavipes TaxID=2585209 RepID=A0A8X6VFT0_TRICX|nr:hypothetical protein TNCV_4470451 [Trichonephila clavipes]